VFGNGPDGNARSWANRGKLLSAARLAAIKADAQSAAQRQAWAQRRAERLAKMKAAGTRAMHKG